MAQIAIKEFNYTAVVNILPYEKVLFKRFLCIFQDCNEPRTVKPGHWFAVHFALSNLTRFCSDDGQLLCFRKFERSMQEWNLYSFGTVSKSRQNLPNEAIARYRKLKNLIFNNSVLFQHFGILDVNVVTQVCDYFMIDCHKVCSTHIVKFQTAKEMQYYDEVANTVYSLDGPCPSLDVTLLRKKESVDLQKDDVVSYMKYYNALLD